MALKYSSKYDISYINYNNKNIPWQINSSFISQNNQNINPSLNLGSINNNLLIESSQNDIVLRTPQNKKVIVNNSININTDLDVSNNLTTSEVVVEDISVNNILYLPSLPINIIGNLKVHGAISVVNSTTTGTGLVVSKSEFTNVTLTTSNFTDVSIVNCDISVSDFSNVNIINSYIYGIPIGYDKSNNRVPNGAIFSDISLENLILDSSLNGSSYINFSNIIIKSSDDYSKLEISKPLNVELKESVTNISNISLFNGDISCNTLYYSQLFPDIRLNNYIDISIGHVSVSGDIIPSLNNSFNLGSSNNKFNTITSTLFIGELSGTALLANDLVKNLDMSFNTLDIYGTITLNKKNLAQFVSGDLISIVAAEVSFNNVNNNVTDLSRLLYSQQGFDLCLNTNFAKRSLLESSFINLNNNITSISNNVYIKSVLDLCLNRNYIRNNDVSAIASIVSNPSLIYPSLINLNSSLNKVVNAIVANELAFPYAITYVDDAYEDNFLKEDYSYQINVPGVFTRSFELNTILQTWDWHYNNARDVTGRSLADILNSTENEQIRVMVSAQNQPTWTAGKRKVDVFSRDRTSATWEWITGSPWDYTNWDGGEPGGYENRVKMHQNGAWHDHPSGETSPAAYVTVVNIPGRNDNYNETKPKLPIIVASSNGSVVATGTSVQSGPNNAINNTASNTGYLKISENNINNSYYSTINTQTLHADTCSLAMSNDGMFIAFIQGSSPGYPVLKVNMRKSDGWGQQLGSTISLTDSYGNYQTMASGIIPTIFGGDWKKNIQNLAINYISGENPPRIFLAFGSARSKVSIYSYDNANWTFSNGFYSVTGGSWVLKHTHLASTLGASTNFGYFVVLSHNPRILVFTIDDRFYTYNCSDSSFDARGSNTFIRLPTGVTNFTNIIALKITSDADKIIVSNTHYVYIYKWNNASWTSIRVIDFNVTFNYGSTNNIPAGPRSLDISNINSNNNDCVFAIGFPDKLITSRANNKSRGYVEYYQCLTSSPSAIITKLATLVPRKRDINNNNVDTNEYFFSAGGIKITNANTILVSPNFKFHFNNTTKNYQYNSSTLSWAAHNTNATSVTGRTMASIENELEQELVRINARNNQLWLGGRRRTSSVNASGRTSIDWEWSSPDSSWNYVSFAINEPNNTGEKRLHFRGDGLWNDLSETSALQAMYMTRSLSYSLNTFVIFDKFFFHSSGFFSSYFPTDVSNLVIARWATTDTPLNRSIEIRASGQIFSRSYGAISDIRLKENIVDVSPKLVDLLKVRVVNYNLKGCKDAKFIGVVAQELEQIFPALVKDGDLSPQDINLHKTETYKYVKYSCFDIMLIKAFQEQMDIINKLSFQVDELETKTKLLKTIRQHNVILNEDLDFLKRENDLLKEKINIITMLMTK